MTAAEFTQAREILGTTDEELAADFDVTPHIVRAWADGSVPIPRRFAQEIRWRAAAEERQAALRESGLPECEWMRVHDGEPLPSDPDELIEASEAMVSHAKSCPVCMARTRYLEERLGPMPDPPLDMWVRAFALIGRIPVWARPAVLGAIALGGIVVFRSLFLIPRLISEPAKIGAVLVAMLTAAVAGAAGGAVYSLTRPALAKLGRTGDYLTGVLCVFSYVLALALITPYTFGERMIENESDWVVVALLSTFFGLIVGHVGFRRRRPRSRA